MNELAAPLLQDFINICWWVLYLCGAVAIILGLVISTVFLLFGLVDYFMQKRDQGRRVKTD
jgi:type III secretory pathway component EscU